MIVEDEVLIALDIQETLELAGYSAIGPFVTNAAALRQIHEHLPSAAILDINLGRELSFPIADALAEAQVPFVFVSAYGRESLPAAYGGRPLLSKPLPPHRLIEQIRLLIGAE